MRGGGAEEGGGEPGVSAVGHQQCLWAGGPLCVQAGHAVEQRVSLLCKEGKGVAVLLCLLRDLIKIPSVV